MNLSLIRKERNKTQLQVAKDLLIDPTTLCNYEKGKSQPNIETLCKLADYYHTTIDELVGRKSEIINLNALEPELSSLIRKIIKMNQTQKAQTINFVGALTMFDN